MEPAVREALISVNAVCNLRCRTCANWRSRESALLAPQAYSRLPRGLRKITLTGGEPFLDERLEERVRKIAQTCPRARVILITNGSLPERVEKLLRAVAPSVARLGVRVSLDGPRELHDRLRGRDGAYDLAVETLRRVTALGLRDIGVSFTLSAENLGAIPAAAALADDLGVDFVCNVVQNSPLAYGACENAVSAEQIAPELQWLIARQLNDGRWKQAFRAFFTNEMLQYGRTGRRPVPCLAGRGFFYLHHDGGVFPCNMLGGEPLGNVMAEDVATIFAKPGARGRVAPLAKCQACWTSCTTGEVLRRHPARLVAWVIARGILSSGVKRTSTKTHEDARR